MINVMSIKDRNIDYNSIEYIYYGKRIHTNIDDIKKELPIFIKSMDTIVVHSVDVAVYLFCDELTGCKIQFKDRESYDKFISIYGE